MNILFEGIPLATWYPEVNLNPTSADILEVCSWKTCFEVKAHQSSLAIYLRMYAHSKSQA